MSAPERVPGEGLDEPRPEDRPMLHFGNCPVHARGQSLYQWERGHCRPNQPALAAWCSVLKLNPSEALAPE